jgi:hypothetical protein
MKIKGNKLKNILLLLMPKVIALRIIKSGKSKASSRDKKASTKEDSDRR